MYMIMVFRHFLHKKNKFSARGMAVLGLLWVFTSCNDFLSEAPDNRVTLDNLDKAAQLLTNAYSSASYAFTDWMTDNVQYTRGVTLRPNHQEAYEWKDFTADPTTQDTPIHFWFETYNAIAHANEVLAVINDLPAETEEEQRRKRAIESEALLTRAYGHFMLVNLFGKHYDPQTAASDLGVPYVESPETEFLVQYERNTVAQVYDKVERDLIRGIELVDDSFFANSGKYHFNRNAALAFASRFYLFKGDYIRCIQYSDELLGSNPAAFIRDMTSDEFLAAGSSIEGYPQLYSSPDLPGNFLLARKISLVQRTDFAHGPTQDFYDELFSLHPFQGVTDVRANPALVKGVNGVFPLRYQSLFQRSSLNSNVGFPYHIAIEFRAEEVLLNRIEANIFRNRLNNALTDLQILANRRYSVLGSNGSNQLSIALIRNFMSAVFGQAVSERVALFEFTLLEKRKEFLVQGMRWFDLKRYQVPVFHDLATGEQITLEGDDLRKVFQIPTSAIEVGGLEPNPR